MIAGYPTNVHAPDVSLLATVYLIAYADLPTGKTKMSRFQLAIIQVCADERGCASQFGASGEPAGMAR
jgi:hypothetical protein